MDMGPLSELLWEGARVRMCHLTLFLSPTHACLQKQMPTLPRSLLPSLAVMPSNSRK